MCALRSPRLGVFALNDYGKINTPKDGADRC